MSIENLVGTTLGQYDLVELLGAGGMGAVYRAHQRSLNRQVAIKVLSPSLAQQPGYLERFNREAQVSASLEHKHIVPVYDYGVQRNTTYIVMRQLTGGSLAQRLQQALLEDRSLPSLMETSNLLQQMASALDYAHGRGVIHRDIKPGNIMFDNQGDAHLVDFGIAKLLKATTAFTAPGASGMGTPSYMPPEQWRAEELTPAADQYALAVVVYNMLTGKLPFEVDTPFQLMHKHLYEQPTPMRSWRADIPPAVEVVLERAMRKDPAERYPTATAFAQAFAGAISGEKTATTGFFNFRVQPTGNTEGVRVMSTGGGNSIPTMPPTMPPPPPRRPSRLPWIIGIAILLLIGGLIFVLAQQPGSTATPTQVAGAATSTADTDGSTNPPLIEIVQPTEETTQVAEAPSETPTVALTDTEAPTDSPTEAPSDTEAPANTPRPTNTALPTETEMPTDVPATSVAALTGVSESVEVTFSDEFDDTALSNAWEIDEVLPVVEKGELLIEGTGDWNSGLFRPMIARHEGILLLFQYSGDLTAEISLRSGDYDLDNWRRWALDHHGAWEASAYYGVADGTQESYEVAELRQDAWYFLLFRVGEDGRFDTRVWERDNPAAYTLTVSQTPPGGDWERDDWTFVLDVNSGMVLVESYQELRFPAGFELPSTPPTLDGEAVAALPTETEIPTLLPTETSVPSAADFSQEVEVTFRDDFDGAALAEDWELWNEPPPVEDGQMVFEGQENWDNAVVRPGITQGEGVLLLFQYTGTLLSEIELEFGSFSEDNWRRWTFQYDEIGQAAAYYGAEDANDIFYSDAVTLTEGTWYYLLFRIGDDGTFQTYLWERDNPTQYLLQVSEAPPAEDWLELDWNFTLNVFGGTVRVDSYQEVSFPDGFEMPETPPVIKE